MRNLICAMRFVCLLLLFSFVSHRTSAQSVTVTGMVKDPAGKPIQYANVLLLKSFDSSLVKGVLTDTSGEYYFEDIGKGEYYVSASFAGMVPSTSKMFVVNSDTDQIDPGTLTLKEGGVQLKAVSVIAQKSMFEQKADRMVINVKNSITGAGGTALDVLERSPGVTVSRQGGTIGLNGKNGVAVMIDGKISYMPPDALIQFLSGVSAGNIDKIELITTPPSKYDAAGNAGYINIVLINNPYAGSNGSYFLTGGYANRELIGGAGGNFNYRSARINFYGSYSFNHAHYIQPGTGFVQFVRAGDLITNTSFSDRSAITDIQNLRIGMDYQLDTATIIGALVSGYISRWSMIAHNGAAIRKNNVLDTTISSVDDPELNLWQNVTANLHFQHSFQPGKVLFFDLNTIYYKDNNPNTYSTDYYGKQNDLLYHTDTRSGKITPIHFHVISSDYTTSLGKKVKMEAGAKVSLSSFTNDVTADDLKQGSWMPNASLSANYLLKENIGAAYTSFVMNFASDLSVTAGLRYEYTSSDLGSATTPHIINRKYGELFPSFNISRKIDADNSLYFSYSRRITRPTFNDLAPFTVFFDPKTYYSGNPALQPALANTVQGSYGFKRYNFSFSYTYEANTIDNWYFQTQRLDTVGNILYLSARNFDYERYLTAAFSLPFRITNWWNMQNNVNGSWRVIHTSFGDEPVVLRFFDYSINSTQQFLLPADLSVELTGSYSSSTYMGTEKRRPVYQVDAGLQKKLGAKGDVLRFAANDIFNSGTYWKFGETLPGSGVLVNRTFNYGAVAYRLTYTHHFGNNALKVKRERATGAEEELNRVHN